MPIVTDQDIVSKVAGHPVIFSTAENNVVFFISIQDIISPGC